MSSPVGWSRRAAITALSMGMVHTRSAAGDEGKSPCEASWAKLQEGHRRYLGNHLAHPHQTRQYRMRLSAAQHPFAAVLTCADSRVPPELIFDQGLGDLFVVRVAGNVVDDAVTGSLEYAVEHLHIPLIMVLGHTGCGAVKAALAGGEPGTHIQALTAAIQPAVSEVPPTTADREGAVLRAHVRRSVDQLRHAEPLLAKAVRQGQLLVRGGVYELASGRVDLLSEGGNQL